MDHTICAFAPGSCGEWLQGWLDERRVLASCPIRRGSRVRLQTGPGHASVFGLSHSPRAEAAVRALLAQHPTPAKDLHFRLENPLPRGKGMASSTADITACLAATLHMLGCRYDPPTLARLAAALEPSDSIMYPQLALIDSLTGECLETLAAPPDMALLALDFGGTVDTLQQLRREQRPVGSNHLLYDALATLRHGLREGDCHIIGKASEISARANRINHHKPALLAAKKLSDAVGGYGISISHTGPLVTLLLPDDPERCEHARQAAEKAFPELEAIYLEHTGPGGITVTENGFTA